MINHRGHIVIGMVGLALVVGFFLPWLHVGGLVSASGFDLVSGDTFHPLTRLLLALCPIGGAALVLSSISGTTAASTMSALLGAVVLLYGGYKLLQALLLTTGVGLWMVIVAATVALVVGLFLRREGCAASR